MSQQAQMGGVVIIAIIVCIVVMWLAVSYPLLEPCTPCPPCRPAESIGTALV